MSASVSRIVKMMDVLSIMETSSLTAQKIVEHSGLPASTGYRILHEMQMLGLVHRMHDRKLVPNFSFERRIQFPRVDTQLLAVACSKLSNALITASEIIVGSGQNLVWHIVCQHPEQAIRLRAHSGFIRGSYELDSVSRLFLANLSTEVIEKNWDTEAFHTAGPERHRLKWPAARSIIGEVDTADMQFDMLGNTKGIRRFCVGINQGDGDFVCILTVAEAATPIGDECSHVESIQKLLVKNKTFIEKSIRGILKTG